MALGQVGDHGVRVHPHVVQAHAVDLGPVLIPPLMEAGKTALVQVQAQNHAKSPHVLVCMHTMSCYLCNFFILFFCNLHELVLTCLAMFRKIKTSWNLMYGLRRYNTLVTNTYKIHDNKYK